MNVGILIDCWYMEEPHAVQLYKNIINFVENSDIDTLVLASYDCHPSEYRSSNSKWYINSKEFLGDNYNDKCKNLFTFQKEYENTHPLILDLQISKNQIAMHTVDEFKQYFDCNVIKKLYMFGTTINSCLKDRPLGWKELKKVTNADFFTKSNCVLSGTYVKSKMHYDDSTKMPDEWIKHGDIYKLL